MVIILFLIPNEYNVFNEIISSLKKETKLIICFCSFDQLQSNFFIEKAILFELIDRPSYSQHIAWKMFCINKTYSVIDCCGCDIFCHVHLD